MGKKDEQIERLCDALKLIERLTEGYLANSHYTMINKVAKRALDDLERS